MHLTKTLHLPSWRVVVRYALPNVIEGKLVPVVLFVGLLHLAGTWPALIGALTWSVLALIRRHVRKQHASGILILTTLGLAGRTLAALLTGSLFVYFLQPTVATALVGVAFVGSVAIGRPLAERLMLDLCPMDHETRSHPALRRFFSHVSLWWGFTSALNFSVTLWLLLSHSPTTFILVKSVLGPMTTTLTFIVAFMWFRALMARSGTEVVFAEVAPSDTGSRRPARL